MPRHGRALNAAGAPQPGPASRTALLRRGLALEYTTLGWNVIGAVVLLVAAVSARSVALAGFGLDSLIEILASTAVVWQLRNVNNAREHQALRIIGWAFLALAVYLAAQSTITLLAHHEPKPSPFGILWTAATATLMFVLAADKARTGRALDNRVLLTESRVTLVDGVLALTVLAGLFLNAALGWSWADPLAGLLIVAYAAREAAHALRAA